MGDGKANSVIEYLDNLIEKGKATRGAIVPLKIAFTKVLQAVDGETWENTDVKTINVDEYMNRFANLTLGKYSNESLAAYKSRVNKAITWYLHFLAKPGWTPDVSKRTPLSKLNSKSTSKLAIGKNSSQAIAVTSTSSDHIPSRTNFVTYPFPLKDGQLAQLSLPINFSSDEAERLTVFIRSLSIDQREKKDGPQQ